MTQIHVAASAALLALLVASPAHADIVHLTNGNVLEGQTERTRSGLLTTLYTTITPPGLPAAAQFHTLAIQKGPGLIGFT